MPSDETESIYSSTDPLPSSEQIPTQIGPYRILETLGQGGMGTVFKAEQRIPVKRIVAVKLIKPGFDTAEVIARFQSERQALARMDHPHVAKVLDAGADDLGRPYFVMEYVPGTPITKFADDKKLSIPERLELFIQVCEAIAHAHTKAIIHRDIKSSNVLAYLSDNKPMAKVIDFGVAKALTGDRLTDRTFNTARGEAIGTYESMSPEQADGSPDIDTRTDVYSLGVLLYELLTGLKPFDKLTFAQAADHEIRRIIREVDPPRPSTQLSYLGEAATKIANNRRAQLDALTKQLRSELEWIPLMALRKERDRRYANPLELVNDIRNYLQYRPLRAGPESVAYRSRKYISRNRSVLSAVTTIAILLIAGAVVSTILALRAWRAEKTVAAQLNDVRFHKQRADDEARLLRRELSEQCVDQGIAAWKRDNPAVAVLWFVKALKLDQNDPVRERTQRVRIATFFSRVPKLLDIPPPPIPRKQINAGRELQLVDGDRAFQIVDIATTRLLVGPLKHTGYIISIAFSPDGRYVVSTGSDGTALVWDAANGARIGPPLTHSFFVAYAEFSPNGKFLVTASWDHTAQVWEWQTGRRIAEPMEHSDSIDRAEFSPDGRYIVTASHDKTARVWDANTAKPIAQPMGHNDRVLYASFSPNSARVVTATVNGEARIWDTNSGKPITREFKHGEWLDYAIFSADGSRLLTACENSARVWDASSGYPVTPLMEHDGNLHGGFSADRDYIATQTNDHVSRVWRTSSQLLAQERLHRDWVHDSALSTDGKYLLSIGRKKIETRAFQEIIPSKSIRIFDASSGRLVSPAMQHDAYVKFACFSLDAQQVLSLTSEPGGWHKDKFVSPSSLTIWNVKDGKRAMPPIKNGDEFNVAAFSPDGSQILTVSDELQLWDAVTGNQLVRIKTDSPVIHASFSPDGKFAVTAHKDNSARIWSLATRAVVTTVRHPGKSELQMSYVTFNHDGKRFLTASNDALARIWDASNGTPITPPMKHDESINYATFSPDDNYVLTASDHSVRAWDAITGKPITPPLKPFELVHESSASPNGACAVGSCKNGGGGCWSVPICSYSVEACESIASVLACQRIDSTGSLVRLSASEWQRLRDLILEQFPRLFKDDLASEWVDRILESLQRFDDPDSDRSLAPAFWSQFVTLAQLNYQLALNPRSARFYASRGITNGSLGRFGQASQDFSKAINLDPADHWNWYRQACLLAYLEKQEAYEAHCRAMFDKFGENPLREIADRTAKSALLTPRAIWGWEYLIQFADRALAPGPGTDWRPWYQMTKGIAEYRAGHFQVAVDWLTKARDGLDGPHGSQTAAAFLIMAKYQLGHTAESRAELSELSARSGKQSQPSFEKPDRDFHDWIICQLALREAQALINGPSPTTRPAPQLPKQN